MSRLFLILRRMRERFGLLVTPDEIVYHNGQVAMSLSTVHSAAKPFGERSG